MTPAQLSALKTALLADADSAVAAAVAARNDTEIARLYNLSSTFIVWRTRVPMAEYRAAITWTEVDALSVGKARIWEWMTGGQTLELDASDVAVRQGIADAWASNSTTRPALLAVGKRAATKAEAVFATGTGTTGTPGALVWEGTVNINDIGAAFNG
jgi:hypothetical protein